MKFKNQNNISHGENLRKFFGNHDTYPESGSDDAGRQSQNDDNNDQEDTSSDEYDNYSPWG